MKIKMYVAIQKVKNIKIDNGKKLKNINFSKK